MVEMAHERGLPEKPAYLGGMLIFTIRLVSYVERCMEQRLLTVEYSYCSVEDKEESFPREK